MNKRDYIDEIEGTLKYQKWLKDHEEVIDYNMDDDDISVLVSTCPDYDSYEECVETDEDGNQVMSYDMFCELNTSETWRTLPDYLAEEVRARLEEY